MTIAVDLGRKATKQTNKTRIVVVCCDRNDIILVIGIIFAFSSLMLSYFKIIHDA